MHSALSRTMNISLDDRNGRREVRSSGFSTPAPMAFESLLRKLACVAGKRSQGTKRRFSLNRFLTRLSWRTVRATDVFPIPPTPMRAIGARVSTRPTISSTSSCRPKQALGGGGGGSPRILGPKVRSKVYGYS